MSWTDQRIDQLKALWDKGLTASQIAEELGGVSRNAVIGKAHRLGLKSRPSPVKANDADKKAAPKKAAPAAAPAPATAILFTVPNSAICVGPEGINSTRSAFNTPTLPITALNKSGRSVIARPKSMPPALAARAVIF